MYKERLVSAAVLAAALLPAIGQAETPGCGKGAVAISVEAYLAVFPATGCPLLEQYAEELSQVFPQNDFAGEPACFTGSKAASSLVRLPDGTEVEITGLASESAQYHTARAETYGDGLFVFSQLSTEALLGASAAATRLTVSFEGSQGDKERSLTLYLDDQFVADVVTGDDVEDFTVVGALESSAVRGRLRGAGKIFAGEPLAVTGDLCLPNPIARGLFGGNALN